MIDIFNSRYLTPTKEFRELSVLMAIYNDPKVSQHKIGRITHLSSSMVNNYIKKLQQGGLVSINGNTNRTQTYHLTSSGHNKFIASLLAYSTEIIQLYGASKQELGKKLNKIYSEGIKSVALFGAAETCEVVYAAIKDTHLTVIAVVDSDRIKQGKPFNGLMIQPPELLREINPDAVLITSFGRQEEIYNRILEIVGERLRVKKLSDL